jgi:hypothetical protein
VKEPVQVQEMEPALVKDLVQVPVLAWRLALAQEMALLTKDRSEN